MCCGFAATPLSIIGVPLRYAWSGPTSAVRVIAKKYCGKYRMKIA